MYNNDLEWINCLPSEILLTTTSQTINLINIEDKRIYRFAVCIFTINTYYRATHMISPLYNNSYNETIPLISHDGTPLSIIIEYSDKSTVKIKLLSDYNSPIILSALQCIK